MLNTLVAEQLSLFSAILESSTDLDKDIDRIVSDVYKNHHRIIFNGNNYAEEWIAEAEARGLMNLRTMPEAMQHYSDAKNVALFEKHKIFNADEIRARCEIQLESYSKTVNIEALTMLDMARKDIFPAVSRFVGDLSKDVYYKRQVCADIPVDAEVTLIKKLSSLLQDFNRYTEELQNAEDKVRSLKADALTISRMYCNEVLTVMRKLRTVSDEMEQLTSAEYWPYPSYGRLMFTM